MNEFQKYADAVTDVHVVTLVLLHERNDPRGMTRLNCSPTNKNCKPLENPPWTTPDASEKTKRGERKQRSNESGSKPDLRQIGRKMATKKHFGRIFSRYVLDFCTTSEPDRCNRVLTCSACKNLLRKETTSMRFYGAVKVLSSTTPTFDTHTHTHSSSTPALNFWPCRCQRTDGRHLETLMVDANALIAYYKDTQKYVAEN